MNFTRLVDAVGFLTSQAAVNEQQQAVVVEEAISTIEKAAKHDGLDPTTLITLVGYVAGKYAGSEQTRARAISCLVPRTLVPYMAVLRALGCMGTLQHSLQQLLFKWMVDVYYLVDNHAPLYAVYNAVFLFIYCDHLRPVACQFLCYLTRRPDVTKNRVHMLLQLHQQLLTSCGPDALLLDLLGVYKSYCPDLITIAVPKMKVLYSQHFNNLLVEKIQHTQGWTSCVVAMETISKPTHPTMASGDMLEQASKHEDIGPPAAKRARTMADISCCHGAEDVSPISVSATPTQLGSFEELCSNIGHVELPAPVWLILHSDLLKHVLSIDVGSTAAVHLTHWLQLALGYEISRYVAGEPCHHLEHLLTSLVRLGDFLCEPIPIIEGFLEAFLNVWDGNNHCKAVLSLLPFLPLRQFEDLHSTVLAPLEVLFKQQTIVFKYDCLMSMNELVRKMVTLEWSRWKRLCDGGDHRVSEVFPMCHQGDITDVHFDAAESIKKLANYVGRLAVFGLQEENDSPLLQHASLSLCELVCGLPDDYNIPILILPQVPLVYRSLLSASLVPLTRICACLVRYKEAMSKLAQSVQDHQLSVTFNSIVLDFCDALWRNLAFINSKRPYPTQLFTLPREALTSCGLSATHEKLSITHHPALVGVVKQFFQTLEKYPKHMHPTNIFTEAHLRKAYLQYLMSHQLASLVRFIRAFVLSRFSETT